MVSDSVDPGALQGNILRGYKRNYVRHLLLGVRDRASACAFLGAAAKGGDADVPAITTESGMRWSRQPGGAKPAACFNIGLTFDGLRALGAPESSLATFPTEFVAGMAQRALKLGDAELALPGLHPDLGEVTLGNLLATWVVHDLGHIAQIVKTMAGEYRDAVGPWRAYTTILH